MLYEFCPTHKNITTWRARFRDSTKKPCVEARYKKLLNKKRIKETRKCPLFDVYYWTLLGFCLFISCTFSFGFFTRVFTWFPCLLPTTKFLLPVAIWALRQGSPTCWQGLFPSCSLFIWPTILTLLLLFCLLRFLITNFGSCYSQ